jgi:hypothetical protein
MRVPEFGLVGQGFDQVLLVIPRELGIGLAAGDEGISAQDVGCLRLAKLGMCIYSDTILYIARPT